MIYDSKTVSIIHDKGWAQDINLQGRAPQPGHFVEDNLILLKDINES